MRMQRSYDINNICTVGDIFLVLVRLLIARL